MEEGEEGGAFAGVGKKGGKSRNHGTSPDIPDIPDMYNKAKSIVEPLIG